MIKNDEFRALLTKFRAHQIVGTPVIDDRRCTWVVDDEKS
jgi:hypothetical protein